MFLVVVDTLRPDRLSCYGYEGHETPHIDALAARGVLFERAQAVASWTVPSMGSMLTSLYPAQLGLVEKPALPGQQFEWRERREQLGYEIPLREATLAELLDAAGFTTAAFVNQPILGVKQGWLQGFEEWFYPLEDGRVVRLDPARRPRPSPGSPVVAARTDRALVESLGEWLPAKLDRKLFVWLHLLLPHRPYNTDSESPGSDAGRPKDSRSERYDGEIRATDELVGRVVSIIDETVGLEESLIVLVSDHGEAFDEHGMSEHGHSLHREVTHVPLIMSAAALPAGRRVSGHVRTIDVAPTVLELAGVAGSAGLSLEGTSLMPSIRGSGEGRDVFAQGVLYGSSELSYLAGGYKLMFDEQTGSFQLYDVVADEQEQVDIASVKTDAARRLRERLAATQARLLERRDEDAGDRPEAVTDEEPEVLRELRALGYLDN